MDNISKKNSFLSSFFAFLHLAITGVILLLDGPPVRFHQNYYDLEIKESYLGSSSIPLG